MSKRQTDWVAARYGPIEPLAYSDLGGRPGFKMSLHVDGGRTYLYVAHLWHSGWSVLDVTDPLSPTVLNAWDGPANTWTLQVTTREGLLATSLEPIQDGWGNDAHASFEEGVVLWDLSDPVRPRRRGTFRTGHRGTHRNLFDATGLLHLSARMPGYQGAILVLVDVSDPDRPSEVGRFHLPGQRLGVGEHDRREWFDLHGPSLRSGDLAYLPYAAAGLVIVDLTHPEQPTLVGHLPLHPPLASGIAAHTVVPIAGQDLVIVNSEALAERCREPVGFAGFVDVHDPSRPILISLFPTPAPPKGAGFHSFCARGGRFGPHNQHIPTGEPHLFSEQDVCFLTYFNAGLRVFDVRDPYLVEEVAYIIPHDPMRRHGPLPTELVVQVEDVLVDARGIVYFTEKNSGLYVAEWKGL
ncbi:MAG TPA: hypothetical protein VKY90_01835 [Candidatus Dormibacteraeota bacterium]|nr:hypothetical protein [Candidatus Dormibacteraeota bacterium]